MNQPDTTPLSNRTGVLLVGHGTRNTQGQRQFLDLAEQLAAKLFPAPVQPAFLELANPDIDESIGRLVEQGIDELLIVPLLLFAAGHAKDDVPHAVQQALIRHGAPTLPTMQAAHLGCHDALLQLSRMRLRQSLAGMPTDDALLLLVGRGSRDDSATAEMHQFARLRCEQENIRTEVAFLAMARPLLQEKIAEITAAPHPRVIVQPHLLFEGDLVDSLREHVEDATRQHPRIDWHIAPLLADEPGDMGPGNQLLLEAVVSRCHAAMNSCCRCYGG